MDWENHPSVEIETPLSRHERKIPSDHEGPLGMV
jgi:hypothetical protein